MKRFSLAVISLFIVACASKELANEAQFSGFLEDYSQLQEFNVETGVGLIWLAEDLGERGYTKVILEPTVIYPGLKYDSEEAQEFSSEIKAYMDIGIQTQVGNKGLIVTDNPGTDTVRVRFALTSVDISNKDFEAYEYIPVAFVWATAKSVAGAREQAVELFWEAEMTDSVTGEVLGRSVRKGRGGNLENKNAVLTQENLLPVIDKWIIDAGNVAGYIQGTFKY